MPRKKQPSAGGDRRSRGYWATFNTVSMRMRVLLGACVRVKARAGLALPRPAPDHPPHAAISLRSGGD
jgi:hypothetical protein